MSVPALQPRPAPNPSSSDAVPNRLGALRRPRGPAGRWRRRQDAAAVLAVAGTAALGLAGPAAADTYVSELRPVPIAAGPPAETAWIDRTPEGSRVRVAAVGGVARTVARSSHRKAQHWQLTLSRDGRLLAVTGEETTSIVPVADGGQPFVLPTGDGYSFSEPRWAPDGHGLLVVGSRISRCTITPAVRCRSIAPRVNREYGATVSPDGGSFAYVRDRPHATKLGTGDLVVVGPDDRARVVEPTRDTRSGSSFPTPPVWTRAGLAWSVQSGPRRDNDLDVTRTRTRLLGLDGHIRTVQAAAAGPGRSVSFVPISDAPGGELLGVRLNGSALSLRLLGADGVLRRYGVALRPARRGPELSVLGLRGDGRVAVRADVEDGEQRLYLVAPGQHGLGAPVARGIAVDATVAFPDEAKSF